MGISLRLQRFCCCCSLKTGTLLIGTLGWLGNLFQLFIIPTRMLLDSDDSTIIRVNASRIVSCVISLLVYILLVVGVHKKNNKFMMPWLVFQALGSSVISIGCLTCFGAIFFVDSSLATFLIVFTVALLVMGSVGWYCWICVWSHYMELNDMKAVISPNVQYSPTHVSPPPYSKAGAPLV